MPFSRCRSTLPVLKNPANVHRAVPLTAEEFHYAFTNTLDEEPPTRHTSATRCRRRRGSCSRAAWPASPRTPRRPTTSPTTTARRCCSSPAAVITSSRRPCRRRTTRRTQTLGRHHRPRGVSRAGPLHCGEAGWEAVADFALDWALDPKPGVLDTSSQND